MTLQTLDTWHELVRTRNTKGLSSLLADQVTFYSPVVHRPQVGKADYDPVPLRPPFTCSSTNLSDMSGELTGPRNAALEFEVEIDGISVNGIDLIKWDEEGKTSSSRFLSARSRQNNLIHQKMAALLQA